MLAWCSRAHIPAWCASLAMNETNDDFDEIFRPVERGGIFLLSTFGNEPISLMALAPTSLI